MGLFKRGERSGRLYQRNVFFAPYRKEENAYNLVITCLWLRSDTKVNRTTSAGTHLVERTIICAKFSGLFKIIIMWNEVEWIKEDNHISCIEMSFLVCFRCLFVLGFFFLFVWVFYCRNIWILQNQQQNQHTRELISARST